MEPTENRIPEGAHIVAWVSNEIREKRREFTSILDQQLVLQSGTKTSEMLQVLGVALLCVNPSPEDRPHNDKKREGGANSYSGAEQLESLH